jgi:GNAT superfamily N-acetyltransferase
MQTSTLTIRQLNQADEPSVLELMTSALGWAGGDDDRLFYRWKHVDNPFGPSLGWAALHDDRLVGVRLFMRWRFRRDGELIEAVRAVDTATHADYRGQGIFTTLTRHGLDELPDAGVDFVFNTPNDQSRPGYLKLGWQPVGQLSVAVRLRSPVALARTARARVPAELDSLPTTVGLPALEGLAGVSSAVTSPGAAAGWIATDRTPEFLRWRYGLPKLQYRVSPLSGGGAVLFRLRRRGPAVELVVNDLLVGPGTPPGEADRAVRRLLRETRADHAVGIARSGQRHRRAIAGPGLVWRAAANSSPVPPIERWGLTMGDVELF